MIWVIIKLIFSFILIVSAISGVNYLTYMDYANEGYNVRWDYLRGCEIELRNIDNSVSWESCFIAGNAHVINNYGTKR